MARTTASMKHTHKYHRLDSTGLWYCAECTHYMPGNMPPPNGRMSKCWQCEKPFQLSPWSMREDKPVCENCEEGLDVAAQLMRAHGMTDEPTDIMSKISAKAKQRSMADVVPTVIEPEEDEIEVIEADEAHAADCSIYSGMDCDCK